MSKKDKIKECVEAAVTRIRKEVELKFNKESHHKSGRSGNHGKKFNMISTAISNSKNNEVFLSETKCFENNKEKALVIKEFEKQAKRFQSKAKSINHK